MLVNRVFENRKVFDKRKSKGAKAARRALGMIGFPLESDFENIVRSNLILNFPIV